MSVQTTWLSSQRNSNESLSPKQRELLQFNSDDYWRLEGQFICSISQVSDPRSSEASRQAWSANNFWKPLSDPGDKVTLVSPKLLIYSTWVPHTYVFQLTLKPFGWYTCRRAAIWEHSPCTVSTFLTNVSCYCRLDECTLACAHIATRCSVSSLLFVSVLQLSAYIRNNSSSDYSRIRCNYHLVPQIPYPIFFFLQVANRVVIAKANSSTTHQRVIKEVHRKEVWKKEHPIYF